MLNSFNPELGFWLYSNLNLLNLVAKQVVNMWYQLWPLLEMYIRPIIIYLLINFYYDQQRFFHLHHHNSFFPHGGTTVWHDCVWQVKEALSCSCETTAVACHATDHTQTAWGTFRTCENHWTCTVNFASFIKFTSVPIFGSEHICVNASINVKTKLTEQVTRSCSCNVTDRIQP